MKYFRALDYHSPRPVASGTRARYRGEIYIVERDWPSGSLALRRPDGTGIPLSVPWTMVSIEVEDNSTSNAW